MPFSGLAKEVTAKLRGYSSEESTWMDVQTDASGNATVVNAFGGSLSVQATTGTFSIGGVYETSARIKIDSGIVLPNYLAISAASSGDNTLIAAVAGTKMRVLSLVLSASGAVNARFQSAAAGDYLTGLFYMTTNSMIVLPHNPHGWFETDKGELLNLELSGAVAVGGCLTYIEDY